MAKSEGITEAGQRYQRESFEFFKALRKKL